MDVPGIDCVLFADPRRSAVDIVQAVGRALRPAPGKKLGYVIVPILHDADATPDDIFESDSFQEILTTLRALAANDDRIIEYFRAVSQGRQRTGGGSVEFDMDERLAKRIDLAQFVREIDLRCWDRLAKLSWRPFKDARAYAQTLRLRNVTDWLSFSKGLTPDLGKLPADIPVAPQHSYAGKGWSSWGDWLGTGKVAYHLREPRSFNEARAFARKLKLKNHDEWYLLCRGKMPQRGRLPIDIPVAVDHVYSGRGWISWGDWLGTGKVSNSRREFRAFREARAFVRKLKVKDVDEWITFCRGGMRRLGQRPTNIPSNPQQVYAYKGWKNWGDWFGTGTVSTRVRKYRPFLEARAFARKLVLKNHQEWNSFCKGKMPRLGKLPADIPVAVNRTYAQKGWKSWGDWLGSGAIASRFRKFRSFRKARAFAKELKLHSETEWRLFCKGGMPELGRLPADIPVAPWQFYADKGWKGMGDWLGTGNIAPRLKNYRPFRKAREFARKRKLKSGSEWSAFTQGRLPRLGKLPEDIPASPSGTYASKGWKGMGDWLGTGRTRPTRRKKK